VYSLERHQPISTPHSPASKPINLPTSSRASSSSSSSHGIVRPESKLRYAAYDAPRPIGSLRRGVSSGRSVSGSSQSDLASVGGSDTGAPSRGSSVELLSRTITAGDLTLAAARQDLETNPQVIVSWGWFWIYSHHSLLGASSERRHKSGSRRFGKYH
jgi:hypothetical protein